MYYVFNKTCIGYSHLKNRKPCQDFSATYKDNDRIIVTCCDGHGGKQYVRSQVGSRLASDAIINVFKNIKYPFLFEEENEHFIETIKLSILCEYNKLVEREIARRPIRRYEVMDLDEEEIDTLRLNPAKAYGTTLSGAMIYKNRLVVVSIGDTEALGVRKGELIRLFDNSDDPAGNVTYSMCQEDAFKYLRVAVMPAKNLDGVILCTDGMSSPYQSYENFKNSFVKPTVRKVLMTKSLNEIDRGVDTVALELGVGDDVSLAFILNSQVSAKHYQ